MNISDEILTKEDTKKITKQISGEETFKQIESIGELDFSASLDDGTRFRVNAYKQKGNYALAIRIINAKVPKFDPDLLDEYTELDMEYSTMVNMYDTLQDELQAQADSLKETIGTEAQDTHMLGS